MNNIFSETQYEKSEKYYFYYSINNRDKVNKEKIYTINDMEKITNYSEKFKDDNDEYQKYIMMEIINKLKEIFNKSFITIFKIPDDDLDLNSNKINSEESEETKSESKIIHLGKKTERFNVKEEKIDYRLDYYKKCFLISFLTFILKETQKLINNCKFCKKFGNTKLHMPNRNLYTGNTKEKDNKEFMGKTIEKVFSDYLVKVKESKEKDINNLKSEKEDNQIEEKTGEKKDGFSRQRQNEKLFNKIRNTFESLEIKIIKDDKYIIQYNAVGKLIKYLELTIDEALDIYYDSEDFKQFKSSAKIQNWDEKFKKERNRGFSLLEKGGFRKLVNLPFYSKKNI